MRRVFSITDCLHAAPGDRSVSSSVGMLRVMLASLARHNDCEVYLNIVGPLPELDPAWRARVFQVPEGDWRGKRMSCKFVRLASMPFDEGDQVMVLDTDLLIQADIFSGWPEADILVTTRVRESPWVCNGGVWGFPVGPKTRGILRFFADEVVRPSWPSFLRAAVHHGPGNLDWWCDQEMLCAVWASRGCEPCGASVADLGPKWNWFVDMADRDLTREMMISKVGNPEYRILHFKGGIREYYREAIEKAGFKGK